MGCCATPSASLPHRVPVLEPPSPVTDQRYVTGKQLRRREQSREQTVDHDSHGLIFRLSVPGAIPAYR